MLDRPPVGRKVVDVVRAALAAHVRELRSQFLLKLAPHERRGTAATELVIRQRAALAPIATAVAAERSASAGFDVLLAWRESTVTAALAFLDDLSGQPQSHSVAG